MGAHASVNISRYKHKIKCAKCPHIAYQLISAKIYLLAAYSALDEIISCALYACQPTYILLRFMCSSRHICGCAFSDPANIYAGTLLAIQLTYIFLHFMQSSRHILFVTVSVPADIYYPRCKCTGSIGKHYYVIILGLLGDVGTHMG